VYLLHDVRLSDLLFFRNDLLVISSLVLSLCPTSPFMESGFTKLIAILATFTEGVHQSYERTSKLELKQCGATTMTTVTRMSLICMFNYEKQ